MCQRVTLVYSRVGADVSESCTPVYTRIRVMLRVNKFIYLFTDQCVTDYVWSMHVANYVRIIRFSRVVSKTAKKCFTTCNLSVVSKMTRFATKTFT